MPEFTTEDTTTTPLINRVTDFLDEIPQELGEIDVYKLRKDKAYFEKLYFTLKKNLEELKAFKDEMEQRGFDSPYFALGMQRFGGAFGKKSYRREDVEDQRDVARHKMMFRTNASFKKGTFERTKSAISSHNIAVGHLEEFVIMRCGCGRAAKGKEATKTIEEKGAYICPKCGSSKATLEENPQGIFRLELLPHLIYGGEFTRVISRFSPTERMAYRELVEVLREKKRGKIKSATVSFRAKSNGKWVTKKEQVELEKAPKMDYEGYLRDKYGRIVIEHIRYHHERSILVSGRYNRQSLAVAYAKILKERIREMLDYLLEQEVNTEKLKKYEGLRQNIDLRIQEMVPSSFALDTRVQEERREIIDEFEEELKKAGLMDSRGNLLPELEDAITLRRHIRKKTLIKIPRTLFAWDIFRFLLMKPYRERRYASIFPGLQPIPEEDQLKTTLSILKEEKIVSAIQRFIDDSIIQIDDGDEVVFKKFEIEDILQDYLKVTSSRAVGGIAIYIKSPLDIHEAGRIVGADDEELKEVLKVIIRLGRGDVIPKEKLDDLEEIREIKISERAKEFLELVR
jgi:Zn-finger domain-containing protein